MSAALVLNGRAAGIVLEPAASGAPRWRHWGARVDAPPPPIVRAAASFALDDESGLTTAPGFGMGWFGPPVLLAHRDGRDFTAAFDGCAVTREGHALVLRLTDRIAGIALEQRLSLDPATDVLTLAATVTNRGSDPLDVASLAAGILPLPGDARTIRSFTGRHNHEFTEVREAMPAHGWVRTNRRGLTGHAGPPGLFVLTGDAGWHAGDVFAVQLAWSGNHELRIDRSDDDGWALSAGEWLAPGEVRLAAGESYTTPDLLATWSDAGLNGASRNFHAAIRALTPWPEGAMPPRKVHLNSWEGLYFAQDEATMTALADRAADLGVERFVVDDGWFTGRSDDRAGLGDWSVDTAKYPAGLAPLSAHVIARGMDFGLWVEPEMVNPASDLYRAHPDWVLAVAGRPRPTARHQLVLDLGRADVRDHLFAALGAMLTALPIAYLKWDHNRNLAPAAGADGRAGYRRHVLGAYALLDRVRAAYPALEIEACAGGGGRIDAAIAARSHRFWTSDNLDAVSRTTIQRGFLSFMPPELMGAHVGASPAHATRRRQGMAFRAAVALPGHFGVELDPATLREGDHAMLAAAIARYKGLRDRLHTGTTWLGEAPDGIVWHAVGTPDDLLLVVTRLAPAAQRQPAPIALPMLRAAGPLDVALVHCTDRRVAVPPARHDGDWLAAAGLPVPVLGPETVAIFALTRAPPAGVDNHG